MKEAETTPPEFIYHLVLKSEFLMQIQDNIYIPLRFSEDKFIHCTGEEDMTVLIANDYFSKATELLLLKIRMKAVMAKIVFESPNSPSPNLATGTLAGGNSHLSTAV